MPPRLSKRQQRELEEIQSLTSVKPGPSISSEEDEVIPSNAGFSALFVADDDPSEEEETEMKASKVRKSKKKKKKTVQTTTSVADVSADKETSKDVPGPTSTPTPVAPRNEKKAAKKARAKEKKVANDELDQALAELSIQYPASQKISHSAEGRPSLTELLSVSLQFLDADAEMRRFFGSKVVLASKSGESSKAKKPQGVRSHLTRPQATWLVKGREGLSLRSYTDDEVVEKLSRQGWSPIQEKWWTVEYSKKYKSMTQAFMSAVMAGDPQGLFDLLGAFPWHADTLLQIAEVSRHREEHAQAVDFVDRALFTYERCLLGVFNFTTGLNRLDFDRVENRPFFLALHRQVADLQRRGCVRTSFEFARLLYGLDPWNDPHGAVFHLEYLSIKAGMHEWFLDVYDIFADRWSNSSEERDTRFNPSLLPGWGYSRALAMKIMENNTKQKDHTKSNAALQQAAHDFPSIIPLLADKLDVTLPGKLRAHPDFKIETDAQSLSDAAATLHLLTHLYVQRSFSVWKEHASWFSAIIAETFSDLPSSLPVTERKRGFLSSYDDRNLRYSVYRHVLVLESSFRRLFSFIPRQVFAGKAVACDPLPPPTSVNYYDQEFFQGAEDFYTAWHSSRQRTVHRRLLEQLLPDPAFRRQLQDFLDAHPHLAEQFPGGVAQFAQMPPELLEDLMLMDVQGGMPGGLDAVVADNVVDVNFNPDPLEDRPIAAVQPQEVDSDSDNDNEEEGDDEEDISSMPRALRNIIGRFFRRNTVTSQSSSEDEVAPLDDTGVD